MTEGALIGVLLMPEAELPASAGWLDPREAAVLEGLRVPKRRAEWLLGRWTARRAGAAFLGRDDAAGWAVVAAADGAPEAWIGPERAPCTVSISHRGGWAACAVAPPHVALGCDLEVVEPRSEGFVRDYFTGAESAAVLEAPAGDRDLLANLVWAAKEAVLKARRTGLRADTRSVEVDVQMVEPRAGAWSPLAAVDERGARWQGWWSRRDDRVVTVAARPFPKAPLDLATAAP